MIPSIPPARVSFVIPVRNDAVRLARCLAAIAANRDFQTNAEVLVADNGSTDNSASVAASAGARVLSLPDLTVAELRNRAAAEATSDCLAFIDADHEIAPGWLASAMDALRSDDVGAVGALYSAPPSGSWVQRMYGALRGRTIGRHDVGWLGSGNLAVRRTAFDTVGGFDASLEACEDVDFCRRLRAAGWRIVGDERLGSVHLGDPATLGALFRAERWRGRDNIRVSLRGPISPRDLPSVVIPIVDLAAGVAVVASFLGWAFAGQGSLWLAAAGAAVIVGFAVLRTLRLAITSALRSPTALAQALLVVLTYDVARAVALVTRAPHHRRARLDRSSVGVPLR